MKNTRTIAFALMALLAPAERAFAETFASSEIVAIPDNAYDGSLTSMACTSIDTTSVPADRLVTSVTVTANLTHVWVGDLTAKLVSPFGSVLGLFSRPGANELADDGSDTAGSGDTSDLSASAPLLFDDNAPDDAEQMGATLGSQGVICQDDGTCAFHPNHGSVAGLAALQGFAGERASGMWRLCVGDAGFGDTGVLEGWSISIAYTEAATHTVTAVVGTPAGSISPASATVNHGDTVDFLLEPSPGHNIGAVTGCDGMLVDSVYHTGPITADCTVSADFSPVPPVAAVAPSTLQFVVPENTTSSPQALTISNADGSSALTYWIASLLDECMGAQAGWLQATPESWTVLGGMQFKIMIVADPSVEGLTPGPYTADLCITTNDPSHANIVVPVSLLVTQPVAGCASMDSIYCDGFDGFSTTLEESMVDPEAASKSVASERSAIESRDGAAR